jgi:hypothetical protein
MAGEDCGLSDVDADQGRWRENRPTSIVPGHRGDGRGSIMIGNVARTSLLAFVIAISAVTGAAARSAFDGSWGLSVVTQNGDCAPSYHFQLEIVDGVVSYHGPATVRGRVKSDGTVSVTVSTEGQRASGSGKLSRSYGRGRWSGRSSGARCSGTWSAQRY